MHKHLLLLTLQNRIQALTRIYVPCKELWAKLEGMYDLSVLDDMVSAEFADIQSQFSGSKKKTEGTYVFCVSSSTTNNRNTP